MVREVKLTTYLISPSYTYLEGEFNYRQILKISEGQFRVFEEIARGVVLTLERSDFFFLWLHKVELDHGELLALKYNLLAPRRNISFCIRF